MLLSFDFVYQNLKNVLLDIGSAVTIETDPNNSSNSARAALGAVAVGGILATLVVGPVTGVAVAGAALYACTRKDNIGEVARTTGSLAAAGFDKMVELDSQYKIVDQLKDATSAAYSKAKEINNEYKITDQVISRAKELDAKYDLTAKGLECVTSAITSTKSKISFSLSK